MIEEPTKNTEFALVFYSGGAGSWAAAKMAAQEFGAENTTLLFTDTKIEHPDLYVFLREGAAQLGCRLVEIADGRTPFEVFRDVKIIGNTRIDPCSRVLKRELAQAWIEKNCDPENTTLVFGIDSFEYHRFDDGEGRGVRPRYAALGWPHTKCLASYGIFTKPYVLSMIAEAGLPLPELYRKGFPHNNCGGACVKAGRAQWAHLLLNSPETYEKWEKDEAELQRLIGTDSTILRDRRGGQTKPYSLRRFREEVESGEVVVRDLDDWGGCACFYDDAEAGSLV